MAIRRYALPVLAATLLIVVAAALFLIPGERGEPPQDQEENRRLTLLERQASLYELKIEKLGLDVPIVLDVDSREESVYGPALEHGVAHMLGTPRPGIGGNTVVFAHSSIDPQYSGQFEPAFERIGELEYGDELVITYTRSDEEYRYSVRGQEIVDPEDMRLSEQTPDTRLTLSTCWPIGTLDSRLIVWAELD